MHDPEMGILGSGKERGILLSSTSIGAEHPEEEGIAAEELLTKALTISRPWYARYMVGRRTHG